MNTYSFTNRLSATSKINSLTYHVFFYIPYSSVQGTKTHQQQLNVKRDNKLKFRKSKFIYLACSVTVT